MLGATYLISFSHMAIGKLNVFTTPNQSTYIVCKLEMENKQYGIKF
jgi:hypothetical protein